MTVPHLYAGNRGELQGGKGRVSDWALKLLYLWLAIGAALFLTYLGATAAARQAQFNQKMACQHAPHKINQYARQHGEVPPCRP